MNSSKDLHRLAQAHGLQLEYTDYAGRVRHPDDEVLRAVLDALGVAHRGHEIHEALTTRIASMWASLADPVCVAWDGMATIVVRVPHHHLDHHLHLVLTREDGSQHEQTLSPSEYEHVDSFAADYRRWQAFAVPVAEALPTGYHRIELDLVGSGLHASVMIMSAPRRMWSPGNESRHYGLFAPLYALHSARSLGLADFTDLGDLFEAVFEHGGNVVGTLPLLSGFFDDPCDASPYVPCSRLAWNELYLDVQGIPEFAECTPARRYFDSAEARAELERLRAMTLVDHRAEMAFRRRLIAPMAEHLFTLDGPRRRALEAFIKNRPELRDYARFRAVAPRHGALWGTWPEAARNGQLVPSDFDPVEERYHLYAQFCCHEQLTRLSERAEVGGLGLYLDLPVGVHGNGFDTWRERDAFVHGLGTGAPPDLLFDGGQNWAFPPLHPDHIRAQHYRYPIAIIRNHLRYARALRIDHVMGLHRLYVVPQGASARDGVYLSYRHQEWYAILSIESHRSRALIIGEDLGTVPPEVHRAMAEHGVQGMHVVEYAAQASGPALPPAPKTSVASVNTHDMPTFRGFWEGLDINDRIALGWIDDATAQRDRAQRTQVRANLRSYWGQFGPVAPDADAHQAYKACVGELAASDASLVLLSLEDIWGEEHPHNVPGTWLERPNWRRRARYDLEAIKALPRVAELMDHVGRARRGRQPIATIRHDVSLLSEDDVHWFNEGTHENIHHKLGAHPLTIDGETGTYFAVWAPNAEAVTVMGDFNHWARNTHGLHSFRSSGIWQGFVAGVVTGDRYKFHVVHGGEGQDKADPVAAACEMPPRTASIVAAPTHPWRDEQWLAARAERNRLDRPSAIYEVHLGSWMRVPEEHDRVLGYRELGHRLASYANELGFTHVEILPVMEHPFTGSWGYQTTGYFAPTSRHGSPEELMAMVDELHRANVGVILDWVPSHFPSDGHSLANFDGTHLYEHADPRKGFHPDWHSCIFNYGRLEVQSFLLSSALSWLERFHADGLRVDAVASMLYLDYSRKAGQWLPNKYGGRENLEAIALLRRLNEAIYRHFPGTQTYAEESTAWPMVSRPTWVGGLGFGLKWDMGWMHDTLNYMSRDPIHRKWHQHELTFRNMYAFTENFVLPLSHDEVVHGKGSLLAKMPGDRWQQFANLRLLYGYMWGQPGKKLLFMGGEFAQEREWNHDRSLDWHLLEHAPHRGMSRWVTHLNRVYRDQIALHELDADPAGFEWIDFTDTTNSVLAWVRRARDGQTVLVVCNFTPTCHHHYRIGVPGPGSWHQIANSDDVAFGGSGVSSGPCLEAQSVGAHNRAWSLSLSLPPLATVMFRWGHP